MFGENSDILAQAKPNPIKDFLIWFGVSLSPYQDPSRKCGKDRKKPSQRSPKSSILCPRNKVKSSRTFILAIPKDANAAREIEHNGAAM